MGCLFCSLEETLNLEPIKIEFDVSNKNGILEKTGKNWTDEKKERMKRKEN